VADLLDEVVKDLPAEIPASAEDTTHASTATASLDEVRIAIVSIELLGAALFLWKRTAFAGGVVLSLLLAWVAGFHYAVGWGSTLLFVFLAAVFALTALTVREEALPAESGSVR